MRPLFQLALLLGFVLPAISAVSDVDFDGKSQKSISLLQEIEANPAGIPTPENYSSNIDVKVAYKSESGEWISKAPEKSEDGVLRYSFLPDDEMQTTYSCTTSNPNPSPNYWKVTSKYVNAPARGGHSHTDPAAPVLQMPTGENLPNPFVSNVAAVNTSVVSYWRIPSPAYATRITQDANFSYACTGTNRIIVDMQVPNLVELKAGNGYTLGGTTTQHPSPWNHYVTSDFKVKLTQIGESWKATCPKSDPLIYNDMSLPWGGLFDIHGNWKTPHSGHRFGNNADISKKWVRKGNRIKLVQMICSSARVYSEGDEVDEVPHYHLALETSKHLEDFPDPLDSRYMDCCLSPGVPVGCVNLENSGAPAQEELDETPDCI
ncbi:MAG: hypothetical protein WCK75_05020 [Elusimicrobiota bacterium]